MSREVEAAAEVLTVAHRELLAVDHPPQRGHVRFDGLLGRGNGFRRLRRRRPLGRGFGDALRRQRLHLPAAARGDDTEEEENNHETSLHVRECRKATPRAASAAG
jgi:hypothetical protein